MIDDIEDSTEKSDLPMKSGLPRPISRPSSRPLSRPTPSARVRALGKGEDLEEVDQNSPEDDDDDDDDEEEEDEEQGIQVEGRRFHTSGARFLPARAQRPHGPATITTMLYRNQSHLSKSDLRATASDLAHASELFNDLSLSDCSNEDEIMYESYYDLLEDERDLLYLNLPYNSKRAYDPADFEHLSVSSDMKELFQYITRYTPQTIELDHKLRPFIPEYIPAVGDIDAFIKIPRPDGEHDKLGLIALDEPCAKQSDPTVLDLQLRAISKETTSKAVAVKKLENADKRPKEIDAWISSIANLHQSKPPPTVHYAKNMPDFDDLMQEWPGEFEECLNEVGLPSADLECSLEEYVDIVCGLLDIPVHKSRIQSLHVLFTLFMEFKNSQHFKSLAKNQDIDYIKEDNDGTDSLVDDDDVHRDGAATNRLVL